MLIPALQRWAAAMPPALVTLALLGAVALLTAVVGLARRGRAFLPDLPAVVYVLAGAALVAAGSAFALPQWARLLIAALALTSLLVQEALRGAGDEGSSTAVRRGSPVADPAGRGRAVRRRCGAPLLYVGAGLLFAGVVLFWRLGSYAGSLLIWEESVIGGFGAAYRAGTGAGRFAVQQLLWEQGLLSEGYNSLLYGAPTYALLQVAGFSPWTLRCAAALAAWSSAVVLYAATRPIFGRTVAAAAAVLLAVNTSVLFYGRYGSSPAATLLAVLLALWATWAFLEHDRAAWWLGPVAGFVLYLATLQYSPARLVVVVLLALASVVPLVCWRRTSWQRLVGLIGLWAVALGVWQVQGMFDRHEYFVAARGEQIQHFFEHRDYLRDYLGRAIEPEAITAFDKIELVYRVLERTIPEYWGLVRPGVNPLPPGGVISIDPPPLPLYFAPLLVFVVWGLVSSLTQWRSWPHLSLLLWVVATSVPLLLTTRVDAHRAALLVVPVCLWAALGLRSARAVVSRAGLPDAALHGVAIVLLATCAWADVDLLYFSPERLHARFPYAVRFGPYPRPYLATAGAVLAEELGRLPGAVAVGIVLDPRDRGVTELALLERYRRDHGRPGVLLPEGLLNGLRDVEAHPEAVHELAAIALRQTVLLAPPALFRRAGEAADRRGLRVVETGESGLGVMRIDGGVGITGLSDDALRGRTPTPQAAPPTPDHGMGRMWVSGLSPVATTYGFSPPQLDRTWGGGQMEMGGVVYRRGIGVHAWTRLSYAVPSGASAFEAVVGLADDTQDCESAAVTFVVQDQAEHVLFDSGVVVPGVPPRRIVVPLDDVSHVVLLVTEGGNGRDCDHANWADAAFVMPQSEADGAARGED